MSIIHGETILVVDIGVDSVVRDASSSCVICHCICCSVVNGIFGIQQVSSWQTELLSRSLSLGDRDWCSNRSFNFSSYFS